MTEALALYVSRSRHSASVQQTYSEAQAWRASRISQTASRPRAEETSRHRPGRRPRNFPQAHARDLACRRRQTQPHVTGHPPAGRAGQGRGPVCSAPDPGPRGRRSSQRVRARAPPDPVSGLLGWAAPGVPSNPAHRVRATRHLSVHALGHGHLTTQVGHEQLRFFSVRRR